MYTTGGRTGSRWWVHLYRVHTICGVFHKFGFMFFWVTIYEMHPLSPLLKVTLHSASVRLLRQTYGGKIGEG